MGPPNRTGGWTEPPWTSGGPKECAAMAQLHPRLARWAGLGREQNRFGRLVFWKCLEQYEGEGHQQGQGDQGTQLEFPINFIDMLLSGQFATFLEFMVIVCTPTEKQEESD